MKVLIIGNGAKELALMQSLMEKGHHDVLVVPGNPGGRSFAQSIGSDLSKLDVNDIVKTAENFDPDRVLIVDECYVREPVGQILKEKGYKVFAPDRMAADRVYQKCQWTKYFDEHNLLQPNHSLTDNFDAASAVIQEYPGPWVLTKLSDPTEFAVCYLEEEANDILSDWFSEKKTYVLISDYVDGQRFYISCLVNGEDVVPLQSSIIQRGIYEQEDDPQTKGMGAYSPADTVDPAVVQKAIDNTIKPYMKSLAEEGTPYTGFLAGEFVVNDDNEPVCVNLKCGLSDCASILSFMRLNGDLMEAIDDLMYDKPVHLDWSNKSAASVVLAAQEYPRGPSIGHPLKRDEDFEGYFYPHRTKMENGMLVTNGGRVAIVTAFGKDRKEACANAESAASHVICDDLYYRTDIGSMQA